jgi:hypothetical protein
MLCAWDTRSQQCTAKVLAHPCEVLLLISFAFMFGQPRVFKIFRFCVAIGISTTLSALLLGQ